MAGEKKQFKRALAKWDALHEDGAYSVTPNVGRIAILCPTYYWPIDTPHQTKREARSERRELRGEARLLRKLLRRLGNTRVEILKGATEIDMDEVLTDPHFSDVVTIGHGHFSAFSMTGKAGFVAYPWHRVSEKADHLKLGGFLQRHCGIYSYNLRVPLGIFAVSDHRHVIAPAGIVFTPSSLEDSVNKQLQPVSNVPRLTLKDIKENFVKNTSDPVS